MKAPVPRPPSPAYERKSPKALDTVTRCVATLVHFRAVLLPKLKWEFFVLDLSINIIFCQPSQVYFLPHLSFRKENGFIFHINFKCRFGYTNKFSSYWGSHIFINIPVQFMTHFAKRHQHNVFHI